MPELTIPLLEAEITRRLEELRLQGRDPYSDYFNAMDDGAKAALQGLLKWKAFIKYPEEAHIKLMFDEAKKMGCQ